MQLLQRSPSASPLLPPSLRHKPIPISSSAPSHSIKYILRTASAPFHSRAASTLFHGSPLPTFSPSTTRSMKPLCVAGNSSAASDDSGENSRGRMAREFVVRVGEVLSMAFPVWVSSACIIALWKPSTFQWVNRDLQIIGLTLTMLGMGMTLTLEDLRGAMLMPKELAAGFLLQYTVMPLSGFFVSKLLKLPSYYAAGLILVSCCPGGTASNIVTYLARGNVALSVLMTAASTFSAAVMTPFLTSKLAGQFVAVDPTGLFVSTVQVVLAPVLVGALLNQYCNSLVKIFSPVMPFIAVATVAILCGSAIAQNASAILASGLQVVFAVCTLHGSGFLFGYVISRMLGINVSCSRTISIEVGMQNSVLGVVLASQHFSNPLTAVPCAVSSVCHSVYGSVLAGIWRSMPTKTETKDEAAAQGI